MKTTLFIAFWFFHIFSPQTYAGEEFRAHFRPKITGEISGLTWCNDDRTRMPEIRSKAGDKSETIHYVELCGNYKPQTELLYQFHKLERDPNGNFRFQVEVSSEKTEFTVLAVGDDGDLKKEDSVIEFPTWKQYLKHASTPKGRWVTFAPGLSVTGISYRHSGNPDFSELALTALLSIQTERLPKNWNLELSSYFNALTFGASPSDTSIRFLGVNFKGGYVFHFGSKWSLFILGGWYYYTSFPSRNDTGFENIAGPQLFPKLVYQLSPTSYLRAYLKYSPILDGISAIGIESGELAGGLGYSFYVPWIRHSLSLNLDISKISLNFTGTLLYMNTYSFGVSYPI